MAKLPIAHLLPEPLHANLYEFREEFLAVNFAEVSVLDQQHRSIFGMRPFAPSFMRQLVEEVAHFESMCIRDGLPRTPPNIFVHSGALLSEMGLSDCISFFIRLHLTPLITRLFPWTGGVRHDDFLASVIFYPCETSTYSDFAKSDCSSSMGMHTHRDDSCITFTCCLGEEGFEGGKLIFDGGGGRDPVIIEQNVGDALLFEGARPHASVSSRRGRRISLVIWMVSNTRTCASGSIFASYIKYLAHIGSREMVPVKALAFDVPVEYCRAGRASMPTALVNRLTRPHRKPKMANSNDFLALKRHGIVVQVARFLGDARLSTSAATMRKVCTLWSNFLGKVSELEKCRVLPGRLGGEIVTLQIGGCGIELGRQMWELFAIEHGIGLQGKLESDFVEDGLDRFFGESLFKKFRPRSIFVDVDTDFVEKICSCNSRCLFHPSELIACAGISGGLYSCRYGVGKVACELALDAVRKASECCSSPQGFLLLHGAGGGAGSGMTAQLLERMSVDFGRKIKMTVSVLPSTGGSETSVSKYNCGFFMQSAIENADVSVMLHNAAILQVCQRARVQDTLVNANVLTSTLLSSVTASIRVDGAINVDLSELRSNLVPFPRVHFISAALSPVRSTHDPRGLSPAPVTEIASDVFERGWSLSGDLTSGMYMSAVLTFHGDVLPKDVMAAVSMIKTRRSIRFVDWAPTGFKCGIHYRPLPTMPGTEFASNTRSCCLLANSTVMGSQVRRIKQDFQSLYTKDAFVHHFIGDGMEEGDFGSAIEELAALEQDYNDAMGARDSDAEGRSGGDEY